MKEIDAAAFAAIGEVIESGQFILGDNVKAFEDEFADYLGSKYAIGIANGTDAIELALRALEIGPGDEVITTPFTFIATADSILRVGATPVFCDIKESTLNIDEDKIETFITKRTRAIIPVHIFGVPANMNRIMTIGREYGIFVIEDAAQAFGSLYDNRFVGSIGDIGCFSFYPTKNLACFGDGGACVTSNPILAGRLLRLRVHGQTSLSYVSDTLGRNSRLDEIQAAVLRVRLNGIDESFDIRHAISNIYETALNDAYQTQEGEPGSVCVMNQNVILCENLDERNATIGRIHKATSIKPAIHYPVPLTMQPLFKKYREPMPVAEQVCKRVMSLPTNVNWPLEMVLKVVEAI